MKKIQDMFGETITLILSSSAVIRLQNIVSDSLLVCFARVINGFFIRLPEQMRLIAWT